LALDEKRIMKVLLLTHHLANWSGSELVAVELAEELQSSGHEVDIFASHFDDQFIAMLRESSGRFHTSIDDLPLLSQYDIVYCQHSMLGRIYSRQPDDIILGEKRPFIIYNHLSPYERFEKPAGLSEALMADLILANSPETANAIRAFGEAFATVTVMPNPAPKSFAHIWRQREPDRLKRLLVVSNHLPREASEAIDLLMSSGVDVRHIGLQKEARRLLPEDIFDADAVMTIGKTVQYALRAGCPTYIYDHFAGPGWLTADNFDVAESVNFSGRDSRKHKTAQQIVEELRSIPKAAIDAVAECSERFFLERWADQFVYLAKRESSKSSLKVDLPLRQLFHCEENVLLHLDALYDHGQRYMNAYQTCSAHASFLNAEVARLNDIVDRTAEEAKQAALRSEAKVDAPVAPTAYGDAHRFLAAYEDECRRSANLLEDVIRYRTAYEMEAERSASLISDVERFNLAYMTESARSASLVSDVERYREAYETEATRSKSLLADAERFHTAFKDECVRTANLQKENQILHSIIARHLSLHPELETEILPE
jgi:hypothetical protein